MLLWPNVSLSSRLSVCGGLPSAALVGLLVLGAAPVEAQPAVQQVLMLQSFDRGNLVVDHFTSNFGIELDQRAGRPVNVVQVVVGPFGFVGAPEQAVVDYIRSLFADGRKPDLIVTVSGPASAFARKHRRQLFPEVPLLLTAVDQRYLGSAPLRENEAAVAVRNDFPGLVDDILQLLPGTKQVFMVVGSGELGRFWRRELEGEFKRFHNRLTFVWSDNLSLPEMLRRCANLPSQSAIFYLAFGSDAQGWVYADERVLADLKTTANAPLFGVQSPYLGFGVVGGRLMAIDEHARHGADAAIRILQRRAASKPQRAGANARAIGIRLARAGAVGRSRESVTAGQRLALSPSEPCGRNTG